MYTILIFIKSQDIIQRNATVKFNESKSPEESEFTIIKFLDRMGSMDLVDDPFEQTKADLSNMTYSTAAGGYITKEEFMSNDQGVMMEPFLSRTNTGKSR